MYSTFAEIYGVYGVLIRWLCGMVLRYSVAYVQDASMLARAT